MGRLSDRTRRELVDAWAAWDRKALRLPERLPPYGLVAETNRKIEAEKAAAAELGWWSGTALWGALVDRRQAGDDYDTAVDYVEQAPPVETPYERPTINGWTDLGDES